MHICGGTYRSRRKRPAGGKREKEKISYAERKKRRIERKFGVAGEGKKIGADPAEKGKPRVAKSKRGRELRAAAALKRFEVQVQEKREEEKEEEEHEAEGSETEDEQEHEHIVDVGGGKLMIPVSSQQDTADGNDANESSRKEMDRELSELLGGADSRRDTAAKRVGTRAMHASPSPSQEQQKSRSFNPLSTKSTQPPHARTRTQLPPPQQPRADNSTKTALSDSSSGRPSPTPRTLESHPMISDQLVCQSCSLANPISATTCIACMNVLSAEEENSWRCGCSTDSHYRNSVDVAHCGLCGSRRAGL